MNTADVPRVAGLPKVDPRQDLQRKATLWFVVLFGAAVLFVAILLGIAAYTDAIRYSAIAELVKAGTLQPTALESVPRLMTPELLSGLLGATFVQLGVITFAMSQWLFKDGQNEVAEE